MDRSTARIAFTALTMATIVVLGGCMDASLSQSGSAPASISIQDAPSAIPDVGISITGGGVNISETVGPGTDALVFELPVGKEHEVTVDTTNFIGRRSFVLPPGGAQVDVQMLEKLFIPDVQPNTLTPRLIQVSGLSGDGWATNTGVLYPMDVEVGPDGRIYLAVIEDLFETFGRLRVIDSISDTSPVDVAFPYGVQTLAIDHETEEIYYGGSDSDGIPYIERRTIDGAVSGFGFDSGLMSTLFSTTGVWGVAVDDAGAIYVSGEGADPEFSLIGSQQPQVSKVDPETGKVWSTLLPFEVETIQDAYQADVLLKRGRLFVTNPAGMAGYKIVELSPTTGAIVDHFGSYPSDPQNPSPGEFYAPRRFVGVGRGRLYVVDDEGNNQSTLADNRIVAFDTRLAGTDWDTYGTEGNGQDEFDFYISY